MTQKTMAAIAPKPPGKPAPARQHTPAARPLVEPA